MNIPKQVKVGGHLFTVLYPYRFRERSDVSGRIDFGQGLIMIGDVDAAGNKSSADHVSQVFWHELVHSLDKIYCCNNIGSETEVEDLVDSLAFGIDQVLKDNFEPLKPLKQRG